VAKRKRYAYAKKVAKDLCDGKDQMRYVLTALATAVQERLGEDVVLYPRNMKRVKATAKARKEHPTVFSVRFLWGDQVLWRHYVYYGLPAGDPPRAEELLRATLDVAHELGLLILERGPGQMRMRVGVSDNDLEDIQKVEADWFALCVLQMYGFLFLEK